MSSQVLFVCDGGPEIGGGHVMRSLSLAQALIEAGAACAFLDGPAVSSVLDAFAPPEVLRVTDPAAYPCDWVVLDSYRATLDEEAGWRTASRLAVIDDLGRAHEADLVIDPSFGAHPSAYGPVRAVTGPMYALVRPAFAALRQQALSRRADPPRRALIAFGLTDVGGITARALDILLPLAEGVALEVVTGSGAPSLPQLRKMAASGAVHLHVDLRDMAALSARADIAVGAGGGSIWERAVLGLPSIVLALAQNQVPMTRALDEAGALMESDPDGLADVWRRLLSDADLRHSLSVNSAALCDGLGAQRAAQAILDG